MNATSIRSVLRTGVLVSTSVLISTTLFGQSAKSVISLDPQAAPTAASAPLLKGEASFANAPANFHSFPAARVGQYTYPERLTLRFSASTTITHIQSTKDFQVEESSSCAEGRTYSAGESCLLIVHFSPQGAGRRLGKITISHTASPQPLALGLGGFGFAPVLSFTPAIISTVNGTFPAGGLLKTAPNLAVDGGDVLYINDVGNSLLREIDSSGAITKIKPDFGAPNSIAVDNFGTLWAADVSGDAFYFSSYSPFTTQTGFFTPYVSTTCTPNAPCAFSAVGMSKPAEVSIDSSNNLFMEEATEGALEMPVGAAAGGGGVALEALDLWHLNDEFAYFNGSPSTFAVSPVDDNLFTFLSDTFEQLCRIVDEPLFGAEGSSPNFARVAGANNCGFSGDGGQAGNAEIGSSVGQMAFDLAGNLYFSDTNNQRVRRIDSTTGIINTVAGTGTAGYTGDGAQANQAHLSFPTGVGVDSRGQVYIISGTGATSGGAQVIRKVGPNGFLQFGNQTDATTSSAHLVNVANTGNSDMTLTKEVITGTNAGDFSIDPNTTSCLLTAGATVFAGESCKIGVLFKPGATGARSANLVLLDNTVTDSNTVQLAGTGVAAAAVINIVSPAASAPAISMGASVEFSAHVTSSLGTPTGTVKFSVDGVQVGSPITLGSGTASVSVKESTAGSHTLSATYSGDSKHAAAGPVKRTFDVTAASKTTLASTVNPAVRCQAVVFSVAVTGASGTMPTGNVELKNGSATLMSGKLSGGKATLSSSALAVGSHMLTASYAGDSRNAPSTSPAFNEVIKFGGACSAAN